ncbi:MAG: hypothetical protein IVW53_00020 [Chloroflexi bacterium]|nr:hypothetical protein [Chloroflexota bacterium]
MARQRQLRVDRTAQISRIEVPARLDQIQPEVEEVPGLGALHEGAELFGDQLHLGHGEHRERCDAKLGDVEERVTHREDEILADAHLEPGGAGIGERVEAEVDDQPARRALGLAVEAHVERATGAPQVGDHPLRVDAALAARRRVDIRR